MPKIWHNLPWVGLTGVLLASAVRATPGPADEKPALQDEIVPVCEQYFRSEDARRREAVGRRIEEAVGGDLQRLAGALGGLDLWTAPGSPEGSFACGGGLELHYRLPKSYDAKNRHAAILCLPGDGVTADRALSAAAVMLGDPIRDFIRVAPQHALEGGFYQPIDTTSQLETVMRALRRQLHLDTDRVFLFGLGDSADAAWMLAINRPDLFAGVVCIDGYPPLPYPEQSYPFMLMNLRDLPVLAVWMTGTGASARRAAVTAHNEAIVTFASNAALPIRGAPREVPATVETAVEAADAVKPAAADVEWLLAHRRAAPTKHVSHWFRYPAYGKTGWIEQTAFLGDVFTAEQLAITATAKGDRDAFIAETIKDKLAYIEAAVEGRTIKVMTLRCGRVELLIPPGLVDLAEPVTILCNGKKRLHKALEPSASTMLERAYQRWEFQRVVAARVSFSIRADAEDR